MSWLVWIDVNDLRCGEFVCCTDVNRDFHPHAQGDGSQNQGTVEVDDECFAVAHQGFADTLSLDHNFQTNPSAPSRFMSNQRLGNTSPIFASLMAGINKASESR